MKSILFFLLTCYYYFFGNTYNTNQSSPDIATHAFGSLIFSLFNLIPILILLQIYVHYTATFIFIIEVLAFHFFYILIGILFIRKSKYRTIVKDITQQYGYSRKKFKWIAILHLISSVLFFIFSLVLNLSNV